MNYKNLSIFVLLVCTLNIHCFWQKPSGTKDISIPNPDPAMSQNSNMTQNLNFHFNVCPSQNKTVFPSPPALLTNLPYKEWQTSTRNFLFAKRYSLALACVLGGYIYSCYVIVQANKYLALTDTWACWRNDVPLETLIAIPQAELAKELILDIQRRYSNPQNPTDFLNPLIIFIQTIDQEIAMTKKLNSVNSFITKLHLDFILPVNKKLFDSVGNKYKKLIYLKNLFLSWAAEYKINHNKKMRFIPAYKKIDQAKM